MITISAVICLLLFGASSAVLLYLKTGGLSLALAELCILLLCILLFGIFIWIGHSYFKDLNALGEGITKLANGEPVRLGEEGLIAELLGSLNKTSDILEEQKQRLERRDDLRMEWIRGVSHDIRTPLSMVIGYAEDLEEDAGEDSDSHQMALMIKESGLKIRELIEDLNLLSKLEYNSQPLRLSPCSPAQLLREVVADQLNNESLSVLKDQSTVSMDDFDIELFIFPGFEGLSLDLDEKLIKRVLRNILGNSIRHNPSGAHIMVAAHRCGDRAMVDISDDGPGIPYQVARCVNSYGSELIGPEEDEHTMDENDETAGESRIPHIMGMRIAKRIMLSHGGNMMVKPDLRTVSLIFRADGMT